MAVTLSGGAPTFTVGYQGGTIISGTAQASTSGTSIDFTSIPSWVKRITVTIAGVSTNGSSDWGIKLGTSGGIVSTGYAGGIGNTGGGSQTPTTIAQAVYTATSAAVSSGTITISLANSSTNQWTIAGSLAQTGFTYAGMICGYSVSLSGALTQVRITTVNGTDTFDAGSINILYE